MKDRILKIMEQENLSYSAFAEAIGIQRAQMSHITTGRNKPTLDVYTKILERFNYINPDWLLTGKGEMKRDAKYTDQPRIQPDLFTPASHIQPEKKNIPEYRREIRDKSPLNHPKKSENETVIFKETPAKKVVKITVFYSDTTYEEFKPEK